ncbi:MAG: 50S ribosomal protein L29 [Gemmatimonadaceae bacterium]|nr:50S ribosomal protein L29 [Gemmatimonadaceae bacterium]
MKAEEIRSLDDSELTARIAEFEEERFRLKFRSASEALEEPLRLRSIRKDIARLQTVRRERALGITHTVAVAPKAAAKAPVKKAAAKKAAAKKAPKASGR